MPPAADLPGFQPRFTVLTAPSFKADPARHGTRSEVVIALDLARVGTGTGPDLDLITAVRRVAPPHVTVLAGGGVRGWTDLEQLAEAGCDGALVATALQQGTIGAREIERARQI